MLLSIPLNPLFDKLGDLFSEDDKYPPPAPGPTMILIGEVAEERESTYLEKLRNEIITTLRLSRDSLCMADNITLSAHRPFISWIDKELLFNPFPLPPLLLLLPPPPPPPNFLISY